ncbi:MFS transporter [Sciscionella marina]|uniref:MFS transporter n=1 Tax=Sciscionella marina TaxID=508770 RepID=UPI0003A6E873|nr:MFS transporter [Sciscionella marina]
MSTTEKSDSPGEQGNAIRSLIPARIDRLPWSPFHTRMVLALGVAWVLDGLEISIVENVIPSLAGKDGLGVSSASVSAIATVYLIGQVVGALGFGRLADRIGRRRLFMVTLAVYLIGTGLSALTMGQGAWAIGFMYVTRFIAGLGIGGEYTAINAAIDELIPARYRGRVDIAVNGSYWFGAMIGGLLTFTVLHSFTGSWGWRSAFILGPILGLVILIVRRNLPESPRWQVMHGKQAEAEASIAYIEREVEAKGRRLPAVDESTSLLIKPSTGHGYLTMLRVLFVKYPKRSILGASLMITQSFLYNAIFFTQGIVLTTFFSIDEKVVPLYSIPFAAANFIGALVLGPLFDIVGRKQLISASYLSSGALLALTGLLFEFDLLTATTLVICWCVVFFIATAGASSAYLTVSEVFPLEVRGQAIAIFFSIAQIFGAVAPLIYGLLIDKEHPDPTKLFWGYVGGGVIMAIGGIVAIVFGVAAERKPLEEVATPLSAVGEEPGVATSGSH